MQQNLNKITEKIELLSPALLAQFRSLTDYVYAQRYQKGIGLGWHYILDIVWIIQHVIQLPKRSIILDAGAGNGLLQFILSDLDYNVISVDFAPRIPPFANNLLKIIPADNCIDYKNDYIRYNKANYPDNHQVPQHIFVIKTSDELTNVLQSKKRSLIYYRSDFTHMNLIRNNSIDCIVSISALEHNKHETVHNAVKEFLRILKTNGNMCITVSASVSGDWFHEPSKGWCYSKKSLLQLFQLPQNTPSNFDKKEMIMDLMRNKHNELHRKLERFYFKSGNNGMPWGIWNPQYLPVGILKIKSSIPTKSLD